METKSLNKDVYTPLHNNYDDGAGGCHLFLHTLEQERCTCRRNRTNGQLVNFVDGQPSDQQTE